MTKLTDKRRGDKMTVFGYARVSSKGQDLSVQIEELTNKGATEIYSEKFTGATSDRPELQRVLNVLKEGDTLIVTKLDRLARNTKEGIQIVEELFSKGVSVHVLNVGLLENTTMGRFFLQTMLAVAEMERSMIYERTQEGKEHAKANNPNYREGRPKALTTSRYTECMKLLETHSVKQVANIMNISERTIYRYKREGQAE